MFSPPDQLRASGGVIFSRRRCEMITGAYDKGFRDRTSGIPKPPINESEIHNPYWHEYMKGWKDAETQFRMNETSSQKGKSLLQE